MPYLPKEGGREGGYIKASRICEGCVVSNRLLDSVAGKLFKVQVSFGPHDLHSVLISQHQQTRTRKRMNKLFLHTTEQLLESFL